VKERETKEAWMRNSRKRDVNISITVFAQLNEIKIEAKGHKKCKNSKK